MLIHVCEVRAGGKEGGRVERTEGGRKGGRREGGRGRKEREGGRRRGREEV